MWIRQKYNNLLINVFDTSCLNLPILAETEFRFRLFSANGYLYPPIKSSSSVIDSENISTKPM
jgi:hypothetical protein